MRVEPDISLTPFISYQESSKTIVFSEDPSSSILAGQFPIIYVKLVSADNVESDYFFLVQVFEPIMEEEIPPSFMSPLDD